MKRRIKFPERVYCRAPEGTMQRCKDAAEPHEDASDVIRMAIERELKRRERSKGDR